MYTTELVGYFFFFKPSGRFLKNAFGDHTNYQYQYKKNWVPGTFSNNWLRTSDHTLVIWFFKIKIKINFFSIFFFFLVLVFKD
jgi:hypothetical protein